MRVIDTGAQFGYSVGNIFNNWPEGIIVDEPHSLKAFEEVVEKADLVMFGGGQDVAPEFYGHANVASGTNGITVRDRMERQMFQRASALGIPKLGICRGSQFLCAMAGGFLVQDVDGHGGTHQIKLFNGDTVEMTSTHHQMMVPQPVKDMELLAWCENKVPHPLKSRWDNKKTDLPVNFFDKEPEIVYFPNINALAVQGHPEYFDCEAKAVQLVQQLCRKKLFGQKDLVITLKDHPDAV